MNHKFKVAQLLEQITQLEAELTDTRSVLSDIHHITGKTGKMKYADLKKIVVGLHKATAPYKKE